MFPGQQQTLRRKLYLDTVLLTALPKSTQMTELTVPKTSGGCCSGVEAAALAALRRRTTRTAITTRTATAATPTAAPIETVLVVPEEDEA